MIPSKELTVKNMFLVCLTVRMISVFMVTTHYVPDEYWQSLEVAHNVVFNYGYLTWEWRESAIRSCFYPSIFAILYKLLHLLSLDYRKVLIISPRILQAIITSVGDVYIIKLSNKLYGKSAAFWTFLVTVTSWFLFYCGSRTLINTMETALTAITLYHFPWKHSGNRSSIPYLFMSLAALTFAFRPTSGILWLPLSLILLKSSRHLVKLFSAFVVTGMMLILVSLVCDRLFYNRWVFTLYNFVNFNVVSGLSDFYGTHRWHWYFTQGFPAVMAAYTVPFLAVLRGSHWKSIPVLLVFWQLLIYSFISHKEFRFIMPVLPLALCLVGKYLSNIESKKELWNARNVFAISTIINIALAFHFGRIWGSGPLQAMEKVANEIEERSLNKILFLMPCHSLPLYSHLHVNISTRFLTCEPNLNLLSDYMDEADRFYKDDFHFMENSSLLDSVLPDLIITYNTLTLDLKKHLHRKNYSICHRISNYGMLDERRGSEIAIYCNY